MDPVGGPGVRVRPSEETSPPKPGHADTLQPRKGRVEKEKDETVAPVETQEKMLADSDASVNKAQDGGELPDRDDLDFWEPHPPKVLMENPRDIPLELHAQIQLYATNEFVFIFC